MAKLKPEQESRLAYIEDKLMDVFLDEADPANWVNAEKAEQMAQEMEESDPKGAARLRSSWKGERYWEKKNANQTMALLSRIVVYRGQKESMGEEGSEPCQQELDDIRAAEKKVKSKLRLLKKRAA